VYLSRHVVFYETSFPAKDHATALLPSQLLATCEVTIPFPLISPDSVLASEPPAAPSNFSSSPLAVVPSVGPPTNFSLHDIQSTPLTHSLAKPPQTETSASPTLHSSPRSKELDSLADSSSTSPSHISTSSAPITAPLISIHPLITSITDWPPSS
jgi:hypothetical protein